MSSDRALSSNGRGDDADRPTRTERVSSTDLNRQRRIEAIHDARADVRQAMREVGAAEMQHSATTPDGNRYIRSAVESYILELEPLAMRETVPESDDGNDFWSGEPIGVVEIAAPEEFDDRDLEYRETHQLKSGREHVVRSDQPPTKRIPFVGLKSIPFAPEELTAEFDVVAFDDVNGYEQTTVTASRPISRPVLKSAYRVANRFASTVGLDLALDDGTPEWGFREVSHE